jgi:hypothetical protein
MGLSTKQVDYTLTFVHTEIDDEVYVRMPKLFEKPGHVYRLKKSLYGLRQSPLNFFLHLKSGLEARGFIQSKHDPCLFVLKTVICLCSVDDCLFFAKCDDDIMGVIESLRKPEPIITKTSAGKIATVKNQKHIPNIACFSIFSPKEG